jgi:hypothetical protein
VSIKQVVITMHDTQVEGQYLGTPHPHPGAPYPCPGAKIIPDRKKNVMQFLFIIQNHEKIAITICFHT